MDRLRTAVAALLACAALALALAVASGDEPRSATDDAALRQRLGLPGAVALVAVTGAAGAIVRLLLTTGQGSAVGYSREARREHPPVTERP